MSIASVFSADNLQPCQSGGLITSVFKDYQMVYTDEDFLRISNKDSLKDLEQLKDLRCLQYLDATEWGVKGNISNLKNLVNLEVLSLYGNPDVYGDICSLRGLTKLRVLKFAFDPKVYGDISCLKNFNLETFAMTYTNISGELSDVSHMNKLKAIYVSGTGISGDISSLGGLINIEELGISDEYPGNPSITGDLASLDNLTKLKKVSLYSTRTTNCEHFTRMHPNIGQGGCSKDSLKTLRVHNIRAEKKIGKDRYYEPPPDYSDDEKAEDESILDNGQNEATEIIANKEGNVLKANTNGNILNRFLDWVKGLFGKKEIFPLDAVRRLSPSKDLAGLDGKRVSEKLLDGGPPAECTIDGKFIGEEKCKEMMEKRRPLNAEQGVPEKLADDGGPPEECTIDGKFIGEAECKEMMEGTNSRGRQDEKGWCQTEEECDRLIKENLYGKN